MTTFVVFCSFSINCLILNNQQDGFEIKAQKPNCHWIIKRENLNLLHCDEIRRSKRRFNSASPIFQNLLESCCLADLLNLFCLIWSLISWFTHADWFASSFQIYFRKLSSAFGNAHFSTIMAKTCHFLICILVLSRKTFDSKVWFQQPLPMVKLSVLVFILVLVALSHVSAAKEAHRRKLCGRRLVSYTYELCGVKGCTSADFGKFEKGTRTW